MYTIIVILFTRADAVILRVDKRFFKPVHIDRWVVVVYERVQRFGEGPAAEMIAGLVNSCREVGTFSLLPHSLIA
jgi:eukaryotic translation initiation factor 2C